MGLFDRYLRDDEVIGRITGDPTMVVVDKAARMGLDVAILGALIGDRMFVDASRVVADESPFEGEDDDSYA